MAEDDVPGTSAYGRSTTGEAFQIVGVDENTITLVWEGTPYSERSWWWKTRLWIAQRIGALSYWVWPKSEDDDDLGDDDG